MDFVIGGLAAMGASLFSNPFDVLKTRMQLQGELKARGEYFVHYKNVFHAGYVVLRTEGIYGIQKGLGAALVMHGIRNSIRLGTYQWLDSHDYLKNPQGNTDTLKAGLTSAFSGAAGAFCGSPLFLIKTQLQSNAAQKIAVGHQHQHAGLVGAFKTIYNKHGIKGLWRGSNATVLRAIVGSSSQLTSFVKFKELLRNVKELEDHPFVVSFISSIIGGIFQTITITPFDVVSVRLYNQPVNDKGQGLFYKGIIDCFMKIMRSEGPLGFYKGIGANYMRLAPHGAFCLMFWDILKKYQMDYTNKLSS